ncbi:hypothetical protein Tco_1067329 [Tanacetum coccineum]|uniref:Uncharacterized protein n=1 Tax=Tanacetum coccineum TaxID=301880 RepID=A0ABQ5HEF6_9ASTR
MISMNNKGTAKVFEGTEEVHEGTEEIQESTAQVNEGTAQVNESTASFVRYMINTASIDRHQTKEDFWMDQDIGDHYIEPTEFEIQEMVSILSGEAY